MRPGNGDGLRQRAVTESTTKQIAERVTLPLDAETALALRARAREAARAAPAADVRRVYAAGLSAEDRARLASKASELAIRALASLRSDEEAPASAPTPTPPAEGLPLQPADATSYRAARPPGVGVKMEIDELVSQ